MLTRPLHRGQECARHMTAIRAMTEHRPLSQRSALRSDDDSCRARRRGRGAPFATAWQGQAACPATREPEERQPHFSAVAGEPSRVGRAGIGVVDRRPPRPAPEPFEAGRTIRVSGAAQESCPAERPVVEADLVPEVAGGNLTSPDDARPVVVRADDRPEEDHAAEGNLSGMVGERLGDQVGSEAMRDDRGDAVRIPQARRTQRRTPAPAG